MDKQGLRGESMDRLISQFEVIRAIEKYVDNIFTKNMGDLVNDIKAIPSAKPTWAINDKGEKVAFQDMPVNKAIFLLKLMDAYHEGMTKGEIMHKLFPNDYFAVGEYGFDEKWWNSPYESQESEG